MEKGTLYIVDPETGACKEFGGIKEVSISPAEEDDSVAQQSDDAGIGHADVHKINRDSGS